MNTANLPMTTTQTLVSRSVNHSTSSLNGTSPVTKTRSMLPHSASVLPENQHASSSKTCSNYNTSSKFRRELTQPALSRVELTSSSEWQTDKNLHCEVVPFPYRSNVRLDLTQSPLIIRSKAQKTQPNRMSTDHSSLRSINRSKINDQFLSSKGKIMQQAATIERISLFVEHYFRSCSMNKYLSSFVDLLCPVKIS
jgi:hypothetical protein